MSEPRTSFTVPWCPAKSCRRNIFCFERSAHGDDGSCTGTSYGGTTCHCIHRIACPLSDLVPAPAPAPLLALRHMCYRSAMSSRHHPKYDLTSLHAFCTRRGMIDRRMRSISYLLQTVLCLPTKSVVTEISLLWQSRSFVSFANVPPNEV